MKLVAIVPIEIGFGQVALKIRSPGRVVGATWIRKPKLVMSSGQPNFEEAPVVFVLAQKDAPITEHRYHVVADLSEVEVEEGERIEHRATGISATGKVCHVLELVAADQADVRRVIEKAKVELS